jgi:hypothetical protein
LRQKTIHISADPLLPADGQLHDDRHGETLRRVVGADSMVSLDIIQLLGISIVEGADNSTT